MILYNRYLVDCKVREELQCLFCGSTFEVCQCSGNGGEGRGVHLVPLSSYTSAMALSSDGVNCFISVSLLGNLIQPKFLFCFACFLSSGYLHECGLFLGSCSG